MTRDSINPCCLAGSTVVSSIECIHIQGDITHLFHSVVGQTWQHQPINSSLDIQMLSKTESEAGDGSGSLSRFQVRPASRSNQPL